MPGLHFLHDMVVLFGAALLVIALSSRLHIPPVAVEQAVRQLENPTAMQA